MQQAQLFNSDSIPPEVQQNVAIDKDQLKKWLASTGRTWLVFNAIDLVDSQSVEMLEALQAIIALYRDYRSTIPSGDTETVKGPKGLDIEVPKFKGEDLCLPEIDRAIRTLVGKAMAADANWSLDNPPL